MSKETCQEDCPGCRPAILDLKTNKPLPPDHPAMISLNKIWDEIIPEEKVMYHNVTCCGSKNPREIQILEKIALALQQSLQITNPPPSKLIDIYKDKNDKIQIKEIINPELN